MLENKKYVRKLLDLGKHGELILLIKTHKYIWSLSFYKMINSSCICKSYVNVIKVLNETIHDIKIKNTLPKTIMYGLFGSITDEFNIGYIYKPNLKFAIKATNDLNIELFINYCYPRYICKKYAIDINYLYSDYNINNNDAFRDFISFMSLIIKETVECNKYMHKNENAIIDNINTYSDIVL